MWLAATLVAVIVLCAVWPPDTALPAAAPLTEAVMCTHLRHRDASSWDPRAVFFVAMNPLSCAACASRVCRDYSEHVRCTALRLIATPGSVYHERRPRNLTAVTRVPGGFVRYFSEQWRAPAIRRHHLYEIA